MSAPSDSAATTERGLSIYVASWVVAAGGAVAATWLGGPAVHVESWLLVGALWVAMVVAGLVHVQVPVRDTVEASEVVELAVVPVMVLLDPLLAVAVSGTAALAFESILTRGQWRKVVFNASWMVVAVAAGAWTSRVVGGEFGPAPGASDLTGAVAAGLLFATVNAVAFSGVVARQAHRSWWSVLEDEAPGLLLNVGTVVLGILAAVIVVTAPLALPLLAVPLLFQRGRMLARSEGYHHLEVERERLRRTVGDSSDGVVLLADDGRVEVWNPAMQTLTGVDEGRARGTTLESLGLGALLSDAADTPDGARVELQGRTVEVRRSQSTSAHNRGSVLSVRDVTAEAELAEIREDLVSRVSHELRTPLTTLSGFLEVLRTRWEQLDDGRRQGLVEAADRGARRLSALVADLMTWARVEAREREPSPSDDHPTCDVTEVLEALVARTGLAPHAQLLLEPHHRVATSAEELQRILEPLLVNAHVHGAPPVTVSAERRGEMQEVVVRDRGPGLPVERAEELFEPFTQGTLGLQRTETGLGLGLAIARGTAELAGGSLRYVDSREGPAFVLTLPGA